MLDITSEKKVKKSEKTLDIYLAVCDNIHIVEIETTGETLD